MKRSHLLLSSAVLVAVLPFVLWTQDAEAATVYWDGTSDTNDDDLPDGDGVRFSDPWNWSIGSVPSSGDTIVIKSGVVQLDKDFQLTGSLWGDLIIPPGITLENLGIMESFDSTNQGILINQGTIKGTFINEGSVTNQASGKFSFVFKNRGTLINHGTIDASLANDGDITNQISGTIFGWFVNSRTFENFGTINGPFQNGGDATNQKDGKFEISNKPFENLQNGRFENLGTLKVGECTQGLSTAGISTTMNGVFANRGVFNNMAEATLITNSRGDNFANAIFNNKGTFTNDGDFYNNPGGTFTNDDEIINNPTNNDNMNGTMTTCGTFTNDGTMTNNGNFTNSAGTFNNNLTSKPEGVEFFNNGHFFNERVGLARIFGGSKFTNSGTFINEGDSQFQNLVAGTFENKGTFENNVGATFENSGTLTNYGTFKNIREEELLGEKVATFTNNGILDNSIINNIPASFYNAGQFNNNAEGRIFNHGIFTGTFNVKATFENKGIIHNTRSGEFYQEIDFMNHPGAIIVNENFFSLTEDFYNRSAGGHFSGENVAGFDNRGEFSPGVLFSNEFYTEKATIKNTGTIRSIGKFQNGHATIFENYGTFENGAASRTVEGIENIPLNAIFTNHGTFNNYEGARFVNDGTLINMVIVGAPDVVFTNLKGATFENGNLGIVENHSATPFINAGTFTNYMHGIFDNTGRFENKGTFTNDDDASFKNSDHGRVMNLAGATFENKSTFENKLIVGIIDNAGTLTNSGTINNEFSINNKGIIDNKGTINDKGKIHNDGTINNTGTINNLGTTIINYCHGVVNNDGSITGKQVINMPCGDADRATITIINDSIADGAKDFNFITSFGNFTLDDDKDPTLSNQRSFTEVPGIYNVNLIIPEGWRLVSASCSDGSTYDSIVLSDKENVTCTFQTARVVEDTTPPDTTIEPVKVPKESGISAAMKHKKKSTLLAIKNNSEFSLYSVEVENPGGNIKFVKARGWDRERLDAGTAKVKTDVRPLKPGSTLIILLITDNQSSSLEWRVGDNLGKILGSGSVLAPSKQAEPAKQEPAKQIAEQSILTLKVTDRDSKVPITNATVIISDKAGKIVAVGNTDANGKIVVNLTSGHYRITIQANHYYRLLESLEIQGSVEKAFELKPLPIPG